MSTYVEPRPAADEAEPAAFSGHVALVTGAGRGIGRSIAVQLAAAGAAVLVVARSKDQIEETIQQIRAVGGTANGLPVDLSDTDAVPGLARAAADQFGVVDILVNNAATVQPLGTTANLQRSAVAAAVGLNVLTPIALTAALLPAMQAGGWGRVVNISSGIVARPQFMAGGNVYATTKSALEAHTLNLAAEIAGSGVTANVYRPGAVDTAMQQSIRDHDQADATAALVAHFRSSYAAGTLASADESAAGLLARLAGDDNGAVWDFTSR